MATKSCFMLLFLSVCVGSSIAYDFFVLAQQWPPSLCNVGRRCVPPIKKDFTIHGLWPNLNNGTLLKECTNTSFDRTQIAPIRNQLLDEWPDVYDVSRSQGFWRYQWQKHGTCSEDVFPPQLDYFFRTAFIRNQYNLKAILHGPRIVPGTGATYSTNSILNAVRASTRTLVKVACNGGTRPQLQEIRLCVDKPGACFIDCRSTVRSNCPANVTFPL